MLNESAAHKLRTLMSDISAENYSAGWMSGNGYALWALLHGEEQPYYQQQQALTDDEIAALRILSQQAGGWWEYEGDTLTFFTLERWQQRYEQWKDEGRPEEIFRIDFGKGEKTTASNRGDELE